MAICTYFELTNGAKKYFELKTSKQIELTDFVHFYFQFVHITI